MRFNEFIWIAFVLTFAWVSSGQELCQTPSKVNGTCISLKSCQYLLNIVAKNQSLTATDRNFLRQSQCGYDGKTPKVCCAPNTFYTAADLPQPGLCGNHLLKNSSIFHTNLTIGDYPWIALLENKNNQGAEQSIRCGGIVIDQNYILTAAHCVTKNNTIRSVRLGEHNLASEIDCECETHECADPVVEIPIDDIIIHENYDPDSIAQHNDIALIRLIMPINFSSFIQPICMPVGEHLRTKKLDTFPMIAAGFGQKNIKQAQFVDVLAEQNCIENNTNAQTTTRITTVNQICIAAQPNYACISDSGGPLIAVYEPESETRHMLLIGIQSFGSKICSADGQPHIYTKVIEYMDWILYHMRK